MQIRICEKCRTKVLPTSDRCCPACQNEFDSPSEVHKPSEGPVEREFSVTSVLVLVGMILLAGVMGRRKKGDQRLRLVA
jgi:hypothetical protein